MIDNYAIADQFSLLSKLMDIHEENSFKAKSYSSAAFAIEKTLEQFAEIPRNKIFSLRGIGESTGKKIIATPINETVEESVLPTAEEQLMNSQVLSFCPNILGFYRFVERVVFVRNHQWRIFFPGCA
jgi:hypothetical protein